MQTVTTDFERLVNHLTQTGRTQCPSSTSEPLAVVRDRALKQLNGAQFDPEEWNYTNVDSLVSGLLAGLEHCAAPSRGKDTAREEIRGLLAARENAELPITAVVGEEGVSSAATPVTRGGAKMYRMSAEELKDQLSTTELLGSLSARSSNPLIGFNSSFFTDGIVIHAPRRTVCEEVIRVVHVVSGDRTVFPRTLIVAEEGSSVTVIEELLVIGDGVSRNPAVSEIVLSPGAHCSYTRVVDASATAQYLSALFVRADRDARFRSCFMNTGGAVIRNEVYPSLVGPGAEVQVSGLALGNGKQHVDTVVSMEHVAPHCESRQLFKGIYAGQSAGSFSGTIVVHEGAQKTNAFQSSKSILLSPDASVFTKPQLKIWADDVKCSHGATVGQIDEDALFYLRSRGIPSDAARVLLVHAFVGEVLAEINHTAVRAFISGIVEDRLSQLLVG